MCARFGLHHEHRLEQSIGKSSRMASATSICDHQRLHYYVAIPILAHLHASQCLAHSGNMSVSL